MDLNPIFTHTTNTILSANVLFPLMFLITFFYFRKKKESGHQKITDIVKNRLNIMLKIDLIESIYIPISILSALIVSSLFIFLLDMPFKEETVKHLINSMFIINIFWLLLLLSDDIINKILSASIDNKAKNIRKSIINFLIKVLKTVVLTIGIVVFAKEWNYDITILLATLGLGGLAFAMAAKGLLENFLSGLMLLSNNSFEHGDTIDIGTAEGRVVELNLMTTIIRTNDNALITIPNSKISSANIKNWNRRESGRSLELTVAVEYSTTKEQLLKVIEDIEDLLSKTTGIAKNIGKQINEQNYAILNKNDKKGIKNTLSVNFDSFGKGSLNILITAFTESVERTDFLSIKQEVMLGIKDILEKNEVKMHS